MKRTLTVLALALLAIAAASSALAQTAAPATNVLGDVVAVDTGAKTIFVKTDAGAVVTVTVADSTRILKNPPGETKLDKATPMSLAEVGAGDRILALGKLSEDGKTLPSARAVVINTKAEVAAKHEAERAEWQQRGIVGVVSAVNPQTKEITIQTRTAEGPKPVVIAASDASIKLRRYAPDSIKFADAKPASFEEVKSGDQLRAKGVKSEDGARFTPEEVVTGTFRTAMGTVTAVDAAKGEITITQAQDQKPLTVVVRHDSVLKQFQLPPEVAAMMAGGGAPGGAAGGPGGAAGGQGGGQRVVVQQAAPGGGQAPAGGAGGQGQGSGGPRRMMGGDMQQMLERMPAVALADIKPGQMIVVSSTVGADPARVTAIQLVSNVEPLIAMMSRRQGGAGGG
ncbi:MAG TPA: hypothetical protein VEX60_08455, partial [Pyrinomonadaceae bacterium]|nr:hypothetical protein [Pyrinomonadaceae bacterium]